MGRPLDHAQEVESIGVGGEPILEELDAAHDPHEQVVEVVGDPPGQDAEALQLLGAAAPLLQAAALLLGALPLGDVVQRPDVGDLLVVRLRPRNGL